MLEPSAVGPAAFGLVFRAPDGAVRHGRCGEPLDFHGILAGQELDFYCRRCMEHVTLPECLVSQVPVVGAEVSARG